MENLSQSYNEFYDLEIHNIINEINKHNYKKILLQLPDGLKRFAKDVINDLSSKTNAKYYIYFGTCFGGCDIPLHLQELNFDLCIQWGHSNYIKKKDMW
jgi:2-(3-amino-3-carboxypropyl)histidine synthase